MLIIHTWGPGACFTNPFLKAERVSYDVITPSAAKGLLRAIYWKPEFEYQIRRIHVLNPIKHSLIVRRERSTTTRLTEMKDKGTHTLRSTRMLRDVSYLIEADIVVNPYRKDSRKRDRHSYMEEARKKMLKGRQFRQPCFGMTEYVAHWRLLDSDEALPATQPINQDLGSMLFDLIPLDLDKDQFAPVFFRAQLEGGVLDVPVDLYENTMETCFQARNKVHALAAG